MIPSTTCSPGHLENVTHGVCEQTVNHAAPVLRLVKKKSSSSSIYEHTVVVIVVSFSLKSREHSKRLSGDSKCLRGACKLWITVEL